MTPSELAHNFVEQLVRAENAHRSEQRAILMTLQPYTFWLRDSYESGCYRWSLRHRSDESMFHFSHDLFSGAYVVWDEDIDVYVDSFYVYVTTSCDGTGPVSMKEAGWKFRSPEAQQITVLERRIVEARQRLKNSLEWSARFEAEIANYEAELATLRSKGEGGS